ncbi:MAG: PilX N-terminal domain-containing pilus assembly protein [Thiobacillaceae bacterium]|jgi:type IV pilus assembly protein PilX|nr:PilX N-terminal domain-containing pilus assembly protein [Thiobacillaceae bacterium]
MHKLTGTPFPPAGPSRRQAGAALVMGMIFLVMITLLGLATVGTSLLEERMAANARDRIRAFQAAEAALRHCESVVTPTTLFTNANGLYQPAAAGQAPRWEAANVWTGNNSIERPCAGATCLTLLDDQPRCIAEQLGTFTEGSAQVGKPVPSTTYTFYRITARGVGTSDSTVVLVQSTVKLQSGS